MKQLLITTIAAVVLVGCGESATDTGKTDVQSTGEKQEAELATFLPGKRIYFRMPMPGDPGVPIEPAEPEPKLFSDEPDVEPGKKPTPPEIVWQFEKDGTIAMGVFLDGEVEFFDDEEMSYKVNGLDVVGFEDGKEEGGMTFTTKVMHRRRTGLPFQQAYRDAESIAIQLPGCRSLPRPGIPHPPG